MCRLYDELDMKLSRVERIVRTLGTENELFLPHDVRISLIDYLVDDILDNKVKAILLQNLLRNGCIGLNLLPDLVLISTLRDSILEHDMDDCPTVTKDVVAALALKEKQLLDD